MLAVILCVLAVNSYALRTYDPQPGYRYQDDKGVNHHVSGDGLEYFETKTTENYKYPNN